MTGAAPNDQAERVLRLLTTRELRLLGHVANLPAEEWRSAAELSDENRWAMPAVVCVSSKLRLLGVFEARARAQGRHAWEYRLSDLGDQVVELVRDPGRTSPETRRHLVVVAPVPVLKDAA